MIQKTNVAYLEFHTYLKRETKFFFQMIWVTLLLDATGFENGCPYNTSLCILHVAKTDTDSCGKFFSHMGSHGMT